MDPYGRVLIDSIEDLGALHLAWPQADHRRESPPLRSKCRIALKREKKARRTLGQRLSRGASLRRAFRGPSGSMGGSRMSSAAADVPRHASGTTRFSPTGMFGHDRADGQPADAPQSFRRFSPALQSAFDITRSRTSCKTKSCRTSRLNVRRKYRIGRCANADPTMVAIKICANVTVKPKSLLSHWVYLAPHPNRFKS